LFERVHQAAAAGELPAMITRSRNDSGVCQAVESLYEKHLEELHRYLLRIGAGHLQARDICQDAYVRLFLALRAGQRIRNPRAWLFSVVHNSGVDSIRASLRQQPLDPEMEASMTAREADPEQAFLKRERAGRLRRAVSSLPASQRHCMHLRAEGLRYREIAEILGISITAIAESVARAVKGLREALND